MTRDMRSELLTRGAEYIPKDVRKYYFNIIIN
jgi:hypothetical protein